MKNSSDTIGNETHDLLTCSAVPQPTAPPRTAKTYIQLRKTLKKISEPQLKRI